MGLSQAEACLPDNPLEAHDVCFQDAATKLGQTVISPPWIIIRRWARGFFHQPLIHEFLEIVVESAGPQLVLPIRLPSHFAHDPVPVARLGRETKQNVKNCRRKGQERSQILIHSRISLYRIPTDSVKRKREQSRSGALRNRVGLPQVLPTFCQTHRVGAVAASR